MRVSFLVVGLVVIACGRNDATPPPAEKGTIEVKRPKPGEIDAPHHDAKSMAAAEDEFLAVETEGSMAATLNGVVTKLEFLPTGSNVAIVKPEKGIARVSIGGAPDTKGMPLLEVSLDRVQLDQLKLPATLTSAEGNAGPSVRIEYAITERKVWESQPGATVTIESYSGKRVKGTFTGKLAPRAAAFGPPIDLTDGRFDVELRLNGAPPGP